MSNPVLDAISARRSIRGYKPEQITDEQLNILLTAAQEAPSARNLQPWHFTVVRNRAILDEISEETNKNMKRADATDVFYGAPIAIFLSCDDSGHKWTRFDCGLSTENIALAAHSIGLGTVIVGIPDMAFSGPRGDYFNKLLKFPDGQSFAVAIAVGIPNTTKDAHPVEPDRITYID